MIRLKRRVSDPASAEDLLHSAFVRVAESGCRYEVRDAEALMIRVAINLHLDEHRRRSRMTAQPIGQGCQDIPSATPPIDAQILAARRLARVEAGLNALPPRRREILLMHRLDGLKYREIAAHFGISQSAVEKHIAKAALFLTEWAEGW